MAVFRTCTLVCDVCAAETLGRLVSVAEGDSVEHPGGWQIETATAAGASVVRCPQCTNERVFVALGAATEEMSDLFQLVQDLVAWADHPKTQGIFLMAESWSPATDVEAAAAQKLWDRARAIAGKPKEAT